MRYFDFFFGGELVLGFFTSAAARIAAISTCWHLVTIRSRSQRFSFERGGDFDDLDRVAVVRFVVFVVHVAHRAAAHELAVRSGA